jgi:Nucleotidyltransferase of unknown function (DUF6036)
MRTFPPSELVAFLDAVDAHLEARVERILIGGGAASLAYGIQNATKDLDTFTGSGASEAMLQRAVERAQATTGLDIPLGPAGVADAPYEFESRLVPVLAERGWKRLKLFALERHDLALSKIVRGVQGDIEHVVAIHRLQPLDFDTLIERYIHEMKHVVARRESLRSTLLWCIDELFGELAREDAAQRLDSSER